MSVYAAETADKIITQLISDIKILHGMDLSFEDGRPKLLGEGGSSRVYEVYEKRLPEKKYAFKVTGFGEYKVTSEAFNKATGIQLWLGDLCRYISVITLAFELAVTVDQEGNVIALSDVAEEDWEGNSLNLRFVMSEKREKVIEADRFGHVHLVRPEIMDEKEVINLGTQVGMALLTAHRAGCIHRDVKLENIFRNEKTGTYELGDFGIVKSTEEGNTETVAFTDGYCAPEIERSMYDNCDATSDIYSLGITLFLLLNDLKFPGANGYFPNKAVQYREGFVMPAPANASEEMARVIRNMCGYKSTERYGSMEDVLRDLTEIYLAPENGDMAAFGISGETVAFAEEDEDPDIRKDETEEGVPDFEHMSRAERIEWNRRLAKESMGERFLYGIILMFLFIIIYETTGRWNRIPDDPVFLLATTAAAVNAVFQKRKEYRIITGALSIGMIVFSAMQTGITAAHIVMGLSALLGAPALTLAGVFASWICIFTGFTELAPVAAVLGGRVTGWVFMIASFVPALILAIAVIFVDDVEIV